MQGKWHGRGRVRGGAGQGQIQPLLRPSIKQQRSGIDGIMWMCSPEHILSVPEGDPSKPSNGRVRAPRRRANPSVPVPAQVGSKTQNVQVQSRPSRPTSRRKRGRVQALCIYQDLDQRARIAHTKCMSYITGRTLLSISSLNSSARSGLIPWSAKRRAQRATTFFRVFLNTTPSLVVFCGADRVRSVYTIPTQRFDITHPNRRHKSAWRLCAYGSRRTDLCSGLFPPFSLRYPHQRRRLVRCRTIRLPLARLPARHFPRDWQRSTRQQRASRLVSQV
jgi:hypothetical protein